MYSRISNPQIVFQHTFTGGALIQDVALPVPKGMRFRVDLNVRVLSPVQGAAVYFNSGDSANLAPSFAAAPLGVGNGATNVSSLLQVACITDLNGEITINAINNNVQVIVVLTGFEEVEIPKDIEINLTKITDGRIDSMCDAGDGIFVCGTRKYGSVTTHQGKIYRKDDSWSYVTQLDANTGITCVVSDGCGKVYALGENSKLWKSTDYGETWSYLTRLSTDTPPVGLAQTYGLFLTETALLIASSNGKIYRTVDDVNFTEYTVNSSGIYRMQKTGNGILAYGWNGKIYRSTDDGVSWSLVTILTNVPIYAVEYLGNGIVLLGDSAGKIWRSIDNGDTWLEVVKFSDEADDLVNLGQGYVLYTTYTGKKLLYLSHDYGTTWLPCLPLPNGDWLDHAISTPSGAVGGSSLGNIANINLG